MVVLGLGLVAPGCGAATTHTTPAVLKDPAMVKALNQVRSVVQQAAQPVKALPGYKIPASDARLRGLDLWDAIVLPMVRPLTPLDGSPQLRAQLNAPQYAVYVLFSVDDDVEDGGLWQYYYNEGGVFAEQAVALLRTVGAPEHADVLARANRIAWPAGGIPSDEQARRAALQFVGESRYDAVNRQWQTAERQEQPLETIIERYVRAHPAAFFQATRTA
jgi:Domain of unknown function (DUF4375)